ncbi:MAG TPA: hypothetical protein VE011_10540 [Candidatus Dormibacteraeota bacterium]|nr:hypothetical protein [Candidatus Dormibacteraeota bacterium]
MTPARGRVILRWGWIALAVVLAGCNAVPPSASPSAAALHGTAADLAANAAAAGFHCGPFGNPHGFEVVEFRRGQPGPAEGDVIDVYS